jgi:TrmH family RNA methyltransferase
VITSGQNSKIKLMRALQGRPKERRAAGAFLAEGVRLVEEALAAGWPFRFALYGEGLGERGRELVGQLEAKRVEVEPVSDRLLQSISETEASQGLLAVLDHRPLPIPGNLDFVLLPDAIRDPGNLGTLLRSAAAAGVQAVLIPPETTDAFAPKVVRAGMGAHFHLPIHPLTWDEIRVHLSGLKVYLAEAGGSLTCWQADFRSRLALIVGGEAQGASVQASQSAAQRVCIPMSGKMESLNAAAAGAILMFEVVRQRAVNSNQ